MKEEQTRHVVHDLLSALAGVLGGILLSKLGLELLAQSHSRIALVVVLHLDVGVLSHLQRVNRSEENDVQEFRQGQP